MNKLEVRFLISLFFLMILSSEAMAAGNGHGSIMDLFAPTVNVSILIGVLIWKIKGPLKNYFITKSEDISNTMERASLKSKEAQLMYEGEKRKSEHLTEEMKSIQIDAEKDIQHFEKAISKETDDKIQKMKSDADSKIKADKKAVLDELNAELLNQVILKTKTTIKTNKDYQNKVSSKLLQGL
jgi:F0F1-type ATP synthase membrane subunit b/b'